MRQMKDSGIEWIGEIPENWDVFKLKYLFQSGDGALKIGPFGSALRGKTLEEGDYKIYNQAHLIKGDFGLDRHFVSEDTFSELSSYEVKVGDVLFSMMGTIGKCRIMPSGFPQGIMDSHLLKARLNELITSNYFCYVYDKDNSPLVINQLEYMSNGSIMAGLNSSIVKAVIVPVPPLPEQQAISAYLDRQCAHIDNIIEKTKASVEEYKKLRQAVITQAVTKGVRGARPMKDSGIEWIGEIPQDWEVSLLKYSIRWKSEKGQPDATVLSLYRDYGVIPKDSRDDNHNVTSLDTGSYKVVSVGDFVINKMKAWQGSMAISDYSGIVSPAYHVCEIINKNIYKKYLHHLLRNQLYLPEYMRLSTGMRIGQWDLGFDDFKNIPFILPSFDEQKEITEYIDKKCAEIDSLITKKEQFLSELESYKKSMIYEYVTGKKEVPQS